MRSIESLVKLYEPYVKFDGTVQEAEINWSALGSVDVATARAFAQAILEKCEQAEMLNFDFTNN